FASASRQCGPMPGPSPARARSAAAEGDGLAPAARAIADVDMDELAARIAAKATDQLLAVGKGDELPLADAGNVEVGGLALHVVAALGAAHLAVVEGVAVTRRHHHLLAEMA